MYHLSEFPFNNFLEKDAKRIESARVIPFFSKTSEQLPASRISAHYATLRLRSNAVLFYNI